MLSTRFRLLKKKKTLAFLRAEWRIKKTPDHIFYNAIENARARKRVRGSERQRHEIEEVGHWTNSPLNVSLFKEVEGSSMSLFNFF